MELEGFAMPMSRSLHVFAKGRRWSLEIRRMDDNTDERFKSFHEKKLRSGDIRQFLPHWKSLKWKKTPEEFKIIHNTYEYCASDSQYRARLYINKDVEKPPEKIIGEVKEALAEEK